MLQSTLWNTLRRTDLELCQLETLLSLADRHFQKDITTAHILMTILKAHPGFTLKILEKLGSKHLKTIISTPDDYRTITGHEVTKCETGVIAEKLGQDHLRKLKNEHKKIDRMFIDFEDVFSSLAERINDAPRLY